MQWSKEKGQTMIYKSLHVTKTMGLTRVLWRGSSFCPACGTRLVTNPVKSHEWEKDRNVLTKQTEHIRGYLWHKHPVTVNQVNQVTRMSQCSLMRKYQSSIQHRICLIFTFVLSCKELEQKGRIWQFLEYCFVSVVRFVSHTANSSSDISNTLYQALRL